MMKELFNKLEQHKLTISSAESITGGRFSNLFIEEPGASKYFKGGFVCYTNEYKYNVLEVSKDIEIVSEEMAIELAINARSKANSDIAISFTGNASADGIEGKEQGLTYIAVTNGDKTICIKYISTQSNRKDIINDTANKGVEIILDFFANTYI